MYGPIRQFFAQNILLTSLASVAIAGSYGASIDTLPRGSVVTIQNELTIPANRNFIVLGHRLSDEINNSLLQQYNDRPQYLGYNDYRNSLFETYEKTYHSCIETHRRYVSTGGGSNSNVIINQNTRVGGHNNTVVNNTTIVNQGSYTPPQTYSYIAPNNCIPPEYTMTTLVVERSGRERLIAEGKSFKVKRVKVTRAGIFNEVIVSFKHDVVKGLVLLTTHDPETISIGALDAPRNGGFIDILHGTLLGIAGGNIQISLPEAEYIE